MRKTRLFTGMLLLPLLLAAAFGARQTSAAPAEAPAGQDAAQTYTVMMGQAIATVQGEKADWQAMKFYPANVTIREGDSITWQSNSEAEPHNVVFLGGQPLPAGEIIEPSEAGPPTILENPQLVFKQGGDSYDGTAFTNSGFISTELPGPKAYTLSFPKAGTYDYLCSLHSFPGPDGKFVGMVGSVTVVAAGAAVPMTPAQVTAAAQTELQADAKKAMDSMAQVNALAMPATDGPNGTKVHKVQAGYMDMEAQLEYMRFIPSSTQIQAGDTVEWTAASFHTVLFGDEAEFVLLEPQPQGPPKVMLNSVAAFLSGGPTHTGTGIYSSGILVPEVPPGAPPIFSTKYTLTFSQPGRYEFICAPHYPLGMDGTVVVQARTGGEPGPVEPGPVGMPRTGSGGGEMLQVLLVLGGAVLAAAGVALNRRSRRGTGIV